MVRRRIRFGEMPHRETRLPSDVLAAAPVHPAKPGTSVNSSPLLVCSPPGPAGLGWRLQEPVSTQHLEAAQGPLHIDSDRWGRVGLAAT